MALLELRDVEAGYGGVPVLKGINLDVPAGSVVGLLGRNGVGKTTTLRTIVGLLEANAGSITFNGNDITNQAPHEIYKAGIHLVQEDRGIFPELTVRENLRVPIANRNEGYSIDSLYEFFPRLRERQSVKGDHLSGGEQQMLAIARALRSESKLLLLDEPSEGLAPQIVRDVANIIEEIAADGTTILLVEQNVNFVLDLSSSVYVMDAGQMIASGTSEEIHDRQDEMERYLGVHRQTV